MLLKPFFTLIAPVRMSPGWASAIHWVGNNHDRYLDSSPSLQSLTLPMVFAPASHHPTMPGKRAKSSTAEPPTRTIANEKDDKTNPQKPVVITAFSVDMFQQLTFPNDPNQTPTMRTVVHIQPESIWASLPKYRNCISKSSEKAKFLRLELPYHILQNRSRS